MTIDAGTVEVGNNAALGSTAAVLTINGGGIRAASAERTIANPVTANGSFVLGRLTNFANTVTLGANLTISADNYDGPANNNSRFIGAIAGGFRVTFAEGANLIGTGALVIENTNTNSGGTTVASGRVTVNASGALANADLTVNGGILNLNNTVQSVTSFSGSGGTVNLGTGNTLAVTQSSGGTSYSGSLAGAGGLSKAGSSTLTLTGANSYSGQTAITNGIVSISASGNLGNASATNDVTINGGTLQNTGATVDLGVNREVIIGATGGTVEVTTGNALTLSGAVNGAGNTLTKTGDGTLNFAVGSTQSYGTLAASAGLTNVNSAIGSGSSAVSVTGAGTTLKFGSVSQTLSSLTIGAGSTVTFTSGLASFSGGGGKAPSSGATSTVPEPGTLGLLLIGALGLAGRRRRLCAPAA